MSNNFMLNSNHKILVVGDVMLDKYMCGDTHRISPEAPVPVVNLEYIENKIGGAGNVAANIKSLNTDVEFLALTGDDENSKILEKLLIEKEITPCFIKMQEYPTITKLRILSNNQQLLRIDSEKKYNPNNIAEFDKKFKKLLSEVKIVVFSDYAKGTLTNIKHLIKIAKSEQKIVIVDPKLTDFSYYHGADIITPNMKEFESVVGKCESEEDIINKGLALLNKFENKTLVLTRGAKGITLIEKDGFVTTMPAVSSEVYDVTGAGDTVVATIATYLNAKADIKTATKMANLAASIVVNKVGTSSVTLMELQNKLKEYDKEKIPAGILSEDDLINIIQKCLLKGEKVVFANGCFDIIHHGHIKLFEKAKALGDRLVVAVNSDESIKRLKGPKRPINNLQDRMEVLAGIKAIDWVIPFYENTPGALVKKLKPNVIVKTGEAFKSIEEIPEEEGVQFVLNNGGEAYLIPRTEGCSSTDIINKITAEEIYNHT